MEAYHDEEWGMPVLDERGLFERLCLEAFQSGLSWRTILNKRDAFRAAFAGFEPDAVARLGDAWSGVRSKTPETIALARELKRADFRFVGPTTLYALMQACGLVNDHLAGCPARVGVERARRASGL